MVSKTLSKSDIKSINELTSKFFGKDFFSKKDFVQLVDEPVKHLRLNKEPVLFYYEDKVIPFLKFLIKNRFLKKVVVDMGAVKFVCGGADIMRPGITHVDDGIKNNDIILVVDEKNDAPLAVGEALFSCDEIKSKNDGKVIKNLHYVSDDLWNL